MFKTKNYNIVDFEILSYNVRGIGNDKKRKKLFNYIKKHTSSNTIVCLQETHSTKDVLLWKYQWHGNMIFSHGSSNQKEVLAAFRYGLEYETLSPEVVDDEGRFVILHTEIQESP